MVSELSAPFSVISFHRPRTHLKHHIIDILPPASTQAEAGAISGSTGWQLYPARSANLPQPPLRASPPRVSLCVCLRHIRANAAREGQGRVCTRRGCQAKDRYSCCVGSLCGETSSLSLLALPPCVWSRVLSSAGTAIRIELGVHRAGRCNPGICTGRCSICPYNVAALHGLNPEVQTHVGGQQRAP